MQKGSNQKHFMFLVGGNSKKKRLTGKDETAERNDAPINI